MANDKIEITNKDALKLSKTNMAPAIQAVAFDTIRRNGGVATRKLILSEVQRRLVKPFDGELRNPFRKNQEAELSAEMRHNKGWITINNRKWMLVDPSGVEIQNGLVDHRYFAFESVDAFLEVLSQRTEPLKVKDPISLADAIKAGALYEPQVAKEEPKPEYDLDADKEYRIDDIVALRKELNDGIDRAIKNVINATSLEGAQQAHKSLLNGISWAVKEEYDQQLDRMTAQCKQMYK